MDRKSSIFEQHTRSYLDQLARIDFHLLADRLGTTAEQQTAIVPVFGRPHRVSSDGVCRPDGRPADYTTTVIVCRYLLQCPNFEPVGNQWQPFRDFPDAAPLVGYFTTRVEAAIAAHFSSRLKQLRESAARLGAGQSPMELSYDFIGTFAPLPRVPVLLLFNDADKDFPAQCSVLFENRARHYLDMECLSMVGTLLVERLIRPK